MSYWAGAGSELATVAFTGTPSAMALLDHEKNTVAGWSDGPSVTFTAPSSCAKAWTSSQLRSLYVNSPSVSNCISIPTLAPGFTRLWLIAIPIFISIGVRTRLLAMRMKRWAIVRFNVTSSPRLRTMKLNTRPPSGSVRLNRTTGTPPNAASPRVKLRRTSPVSIRSFRFESAHSTRLRSSSWYSLDAPSVLAYHTSNVPDLYETPNWS